MLVDRCLLRRFGATFLTVLTLLSAFYALLLVRTGVSRSAEYQAWASIAHVLFLGLLRSVDVLLAVAAPTAILHVLLGLRRRGILLSLSAGGLTPSRLRGLILYLGLAMVILSIGAQEVAARASSPAPADSLLWRSGDHWAWLAHTRADAEHDDLVLFESHALGVWRVAGVSRPRAGNLIELDAAVSLHGQAAAPTSITGPQPPRATFRTLPPSRWHEASLDAGTLLALLLQVLVGPILFLLSAYLALIVRRTHLPMAWLVFLLLLPAVAASTIALVVVLRHSPTWGAAGAFAYLLAIGGTLVVLDRRANRRGLRL